MSKKPVEVPNIGFNEALQRIASFNKNDLLGDKESDLPAVDDETCKSPSVIQESHAFTDRYNKTKGND